MVLLVAHLAELDTRDVHFRAGHGSLFGYCRDVLGLSEQEAYNRIAVARAARRFPVILEMLEGAAVSLTTVRLLGPHLTADNHGSVLDSARGKTRIQVEEIAAALWPRPDAPSFVRKLPAAKALVPGLVDIGEPGHPPWTLPQGPALPSPSSASSPVSAFSPSPVLPASASPASSACSPSSFHYSSPASLDSPDSPSSPASRSSSFSVAPLAPALSPGDEATAAPSLAAPPLPQAKRSADVTPLSPDRYRVQVTIGGDTLEKLRLAKDLLRHAVPSGDEAVILDRALTALLADLAQRKFAAADKPRPSGGTVPGSRHIPAEVKRTVWLRDLGRCAFVSTNARRCTERAFLEFHHVKPYALGGEATLANVELRCRSHNAYEARLYFGHDNGNGGAESVREKATTYGLGSREATSLRSAASRTRSGTSSKPAAPCGPAP